MLPWLILAITTAIGLVISTIYSSVYLFIDNQNTEGAVILVVGLITAGNLFKKNHVTFFSKLFFWIQV